MVPYLLIQVFYTSKDGECIPMFLTHRKDLSMDGSHPTMLYGYGGFNVAIKPVFSPSRIVFLQHMDGIVAVPNLRGGRDEENEVVMFRRT